MKVRKRNGVTGGTSTDLDYIDGDLLADKDFTFVLDDATGSFAPYELDADSGLADDGMNVIAPLTNAGTKRWLRRSMAELLRDVSNGVPGLTLFKINFMNAAGTVKSFFTNSNAAPRTYTFPDRDGNIVDDVGFPALLNTHMPGASAASGYQKFKNGIVLQWGVATSYVTPGGGVWVGYPIVFTAVHSVVLTPSAQSATVYSTNIGTGSFQLIASAPSVVTHWMAIGYIAPA